MWRAGTSPRPTASTPPATVTWPISLSPLSVLAEAVGEPRLAAYTDKDTWTKQDEIGDLIAQRLATATTAEWIARMQPLKIWHAPVQGYAEIVADPQVRHMKSLVTVEGAGETGAPVTLVNHPVLYDGATAEVRLPPQPLGAQTAEVLKELGLGEIEIEALARDKVVTLHPMTGGNAHV